MYRTSELYLAAFLKVNGKRIDSIEREGKRVFFNFEAVEDGLVTSFYNDAAVGALSYKNALNDLKTIVFRGGNK